MNDHSNFKKDQNVRLRTPKLAVIGAGMSGILAAIKLQESGISDVTVYEKGEEIGGTWRDNRYPGVSCDVPAHLYTYSFAPNPEFSHRYPRGAEIHAYFKRVAREYDVYSKIRFSSRLEKAVYSDGRWSVWTAEGDREIYDIVICASGVLHHPKYPEIEGLDKFSGAKFHTARWDDSVNLDGKKIAVIGNGSTSVQMFPTLQKQASKINLFQRTPQWILPVFDKEYSDKEKARLRKYPWIGKILRWYYWLLLNLTFGKPVTGNKFLQRIISWACRQHLESQVQDVYLLEKLRPDYQALCKRLIVANGFYAAIQEQNAELVTTKIKRVESNGILTEDGILHEADVLILATGFKPHHFMRPMKMIGLNGITIEKSWENGALAHRSIGIPGFPNFFMLVGPNSPIGNFSLITIAEHQMDYIMKLIDLWRSGVDTIAPKKDASERFNMEVKQAMSGTVWASGCQSWYIDKFGNPAMWPWSYERFRDEMKEPNLAEFETSNLVT